MLVIFTEFMRTHTNSFAHVQLRDEHVDDVHVSLHHIHAYIVHSHMHTPVQRFSRMSDLCGAHFSSRQRL